MNKNQSKLDMLIDFLHDEDLFNKNCISYSSPESIENLSNSLNKMLLEAQSILNHDWIIKVRKERSLSSCKIEKLLLNLQNKFTSREQLIEAITKGILGDKVKLEFQYHFRNKKVDELTDEDLLSIINDQAIIEFLEKANKKQ